MALVYAVDLVTFAVSLLLLARMRALPPPANADRPSLRSVAAGLRYARSRQELVGTYLVDINAMLFGMPQSARRTSSSSGQSGCFHGSAKRRRLATCGNPVWASTTGFTPSKDCRSNGRYGTSGQGDLIPKAPAVARTGP